MNDNTKQAVISFGLIGSGKMAVTMLTAFQHLTTANVSAIASSSQERSELIAKQFGISKAYGSVEALLADPNIQAVYIANATENHAQTTLLALKAGKAVLCEKPIGISETEAKAIQTEAEQSGLLCMEAMWTLCLPAYRRLFGLHQNGETGAFHHLYADFGYPANRNLHPRLFSAAPGSGVLLDRGVYPIALALSLFGPVNTVKGLVKRNENGVDIHATVELLHNNGNTSQLAVSIESLLQNRAVLSGPNGTISLEPPVIGAEAIKISRFFEASTSSETGSTGVKTGLKQTLKQLPLLRRLKSYQHLAISEFHAYGANQYLPVLKHFIALYHANKTVSDIYPLDLSHQTLRIIEQLKN